MPEIMEEENIKRENKDNVMDFSEKSKDNIESKNKTKEELSKLKQQILENPNIEKQKLNESITTKTDSLELLSKYKEINVEGKDTPKAFNITKEILSEKLNIKGNVFDDFEKAKKILLTGKDQTTKEILSIPGIDAYFFGIIKKESSGEQKRNASKEHFGYGQISKLAEAEISSKLNKTLDRMKGVDNCIILIGYIANCRKEIAPYVQEKDISKFSLIGFKKGIEGLKGKIKKMFSEGNKVSREDYLKKENKNNGSLYVNNVRENFEKINKEFPTA